MGARAAGLFVLFVSTTALAEAPGARAEGDAAYDAGYFAKAGMLYERAFVVTHDPRMLRRASEAYRRTMSPQGSHTALVLAKRYWAFAHGTEQRRDALSWLGSLREREAEPFAPGIGVPLRPPPWTFARGASLQPLRFRYGDPPPPKELVSDAALITGSTLIFASTPPFIYGLATVFTHNCANVERPISCWKLPGFVGSFSSLLAGVAGLSVAISLTAWGGRERRPREAVIEFGLGTLALRGAF